MRLAVNKKNLKSDQNLVLIYLYVNETHMFNICHL
jgi:hypothetical protein